MDTGGGMDDTGELTVRDVQGNDGEEVVTLRLTDAAPFVLQQQPTAVGDDTTMEEPSDSAGTYHIIAQQLMSSGQVQLTLSDGVNILQTTIAAHQLQGFETGEQSILLQASDVDAGGEISYVPADTSSQNLTGEVNQDDQGQATLVVGSTQPLAETGAASQSNNQSQNSIQSDVSNNQSEHIYQEINQPMTVAQDTVPANQTLASGPDDMGRSARSRGKPTKLDEYGAYEQHSSDDVATADDGDDVSPDGALRKRKSNIQPAPIHIPGDAAGQFYILTDENKNQAEPHLIENRDPNVKQLAESMQLSSIRQISSMVPTALLSGIPTTVTSQFIPEPAVDPAVNPSTSVDADVSRTMKEEKKPDLTKPIEVTDHMEVVVNGKKCLLKVNPETGQLCAYPLVSTGKKRGRPKKSEMQARNSSRELVQDEKEHKEQPWLPAEQDNAAEIKYVLEPDQKSSAAQGLLELSNTGPDGVRRSARSRGKPIKLEEYEQFELSSDDDAAADDGDDDILPTGAVRKRKSHTNRDYIPPTPIHTPGAPRRGRGRPRRYPRADDALLTNQIPAMIIPSGDGQTIMMAPIQGLTNLEAFQEQVRNMPIFQQSGTDDGLQYLNISGLIDSADGNIVSVQLGGCANLGDTGDSVEQSVVNNDPEEDDTETDDKTKPLHDPVMDDTDFKEVKVEGEKESPEKSSTSFKEKPSDYVDNQPTIIQIPESLLPMFTQKKDPIKIGLKASDNLEKLKCPICDIQTYYEQQYQEHVVTHDEVIKCKCCKFASFVKEDLIEHFRKNHSRCICTYCDHMAEHAYIIKRHMMRHTHVGCKCDICGKVYKDQYVLKMHVKMVHMPAEVLFECNVCSKKFTRKAHLKRHLRIHDPEKPFKCPQCQYRGCEKSDIVKHLLVHEDPKHMCNICGKSFRHIKNKELHMKRHIGRRDYKCGVCDFYGYTFTDIRKHIERKHTDSRSLMCDKCGMVFRTEMAYKEHKSHICAVFMIEQALAIATSDGGTTQATIQIPSSYTLDGNQPIQVGGESVSIGRDGQITVHSVGISEDGITLTDEQIDAVAQGQMSESDIQNLVSQAESEIQVAVHQGQIIDTGQTEEDSVSEMQDINNSVRTEIQDITNEIRPVLDLYKREDENNADVRPVLDVTNVHPALMYKNEEDNANLTEEDEEEEEEGGETVMDEDEMREEQMDDIVSDNDDKTNMESEQIMGIVNIMR